MGFLLTLGMSIKDTAARLSREAERHTGEAPLYDARTFERYVNTLRTYALRLHRYYEGACNAELTRDQTRIIRETEARALALAHRMGVRLEFQADPRGAPLQVPCAPGNSNYASGEHIAIPWLPAHEYARGR